MQTITPNRPAVTLVKPVRDHIAVIVYSDGFRWTTHTDNLPGWNWTRIDAGTAHINAYCML